LKDLCPGHTVDTEVQIAEQDCLLMIFNCHAPIAEIILERCPKYLRKLFGPLLVFSAPTHKMAVEDHDGLVAKLKSETYSTLIACGT